MIIQSLHIENMLHFDELSLEDIPSLGQIKFSHENPEYTRDLIKVIYFALYGRHLHNQPLESLLYEGAEYFATSIQVSHNGDEYTLMRTFDIDGTLAVQMTDAQEEMLFAQDEVDDVLTRKGINRHTDFIQQHVLQYAFNEDIDLVQQLGLYDYQQAHIKLEQTDQTSLNTQNTSQLHDKLDALALEETWLPELVDARETLTDQQSSQLKQSDSLKQIRQLYPEQYKQFHRKNQHYQIFNTFANLLFPLTSTLWLVWALFIFTPDLLKTGLPGDTYDMMVSWVPSMLFSVGSVVIIFYGFSLIYSWLLDTHRLIPLREKLNQTIQQLISAYETAKREDDIPANVQTILPASNNANTFNLDENAYHLFIQQLNDYGVEPDQLKRIVVTLQNKLKSRKLTTAQSLSIINDNIETEMEKSGQAADIRQQLMHEQETDRQHTEQKNIQQIAQQLLRNAAQDYLQTKFASINPILANITSSQLQLSGMDEHFELIASVNDVDKTIPELNPEALKQIQFATHTGQLFEQLKNNPQNSSFLIIDAPEALANKLDVETIASNHQLWQLTH
jgi:hypothetical protein